MKRFILIVVLALCSFIAYSQEDVRISCADRAFIYSEVVKLRDTNKYSELDVLRGIAKYLDVRHIPVSEGREILLEAKAAFENNKLDATGTFLKYLTSCGGTEI
jgi:hypothetical protein